MTVKKYNGNKAWEFNVGHTYYWNNYGYKMPFTIGQYENYRMWILNPGTEEGLWLYRYIIYGIKI
jgi:hypothetical protein